MQVAWPCDAVVVSTGWKTKAQIRKSFQKKNHAEFSHQRNGKLHILVMSWCLVSSSLGCRQPVNSECVNILWWVASVKEFI